MNTQKTKKVDVVSGYSYPIDKNSIWFDENTNTFKHYNGDSWESDTVKPQTVDDDIKQALQKIPTQKSIGKSEAIPPIRKGWVCDGYIEGFKSFFKNEDGLFLITGFDGEGVGIDATGYISLSYESTADVDTSEFELWYNESVDRIYVMMIPPIDQEAPVEGEGGGK